MNFTFLWQRVRQFRGELMLISSLTLLGSLATLAVPWLAGQLIGGVLEGGIASVTQTLMLLIGALVALTALNIASAIVSAKASLKILNRLRRDVHQHVIRMPLDFHDRRSNGDLIALTTYEVSNLSGFLATTLANAPSMVLTAVGAIILLFLIDPATALIVPVLIPVFFILMKLVGRRLRGLAKAARKAEVEVISAAEKDISIVAAIKAFAIEEHQSTNYADVTRNSRELAFRQARINAFIGPLVGLIAALAAIAILLAGSGSILDGNGSAGDLFAFLLYAALLTRPVGSLADMYGRFQIARGTLARLQNVIELETEPGLDSGSPLVRATGAIEFAAISFAYPGRPSVLDQLNLSIKAGEIVALTGENGVGKSTLVKLLLRYYSPDSGEIRLDGQNIADIQVQDLRRQFGYVPQRPQLFNGTIAQNVLFGQEFPDDDARNQALKRAIKLAQADDFIANLPLGLETQIGDDGLRLSGGQGQRLALARALLRDPPVYILDEATSMYDLESEAAFVEDCIEALKGRTVIIITHRPASLALANRIVRISKDSAAEVGKETS